MTKPRKKPLYYADDKDALFKANYVDSLYGMRMLLRPDGRRRGLWIWLEEEVNSRLSVDRQMFNIGLEKFIPELKKIFAKKNKEMLEFEVRQTLRTHFDFFFDHRTEGTAVRLTWPQVRKLIVALKAEASRDDHEED